jgi:hypothetical protein
VNPTRVGVALVAAMALTACGGSGRLSHGAFVRGASHICRAASTKTGHVALPNLLSSKHPASALERLSAREKRAIAQLRDLEPPKSDAAIVAEWVAVLDQMTGEVDFARTSLHRGAVSTAIEAVARADTLERRGRELADAQGISACRFTELPKAV